MTRCVLLGAALVSIWGAPVLAETPIEAGQWEKIEKVAVEGRAERAEAGWRAVVRMTDRAGAVLGERVVESHAATCEELDPGPPQSADRPPAWKPLSLGLSMAWVAVSVALLAVAVGGWSLIDLVERRIRFVSAVTHELRTPLTTLRLYLDMLLGGVVRDETQRHEYLQTLQGEADRLNRLVGNVLDFSRLEKQQPNLSRAPVKVADLLEQLTRPPGEMPDRVIDYLAGMTDRFAIRAWTERFVPQGLAL